MRTLSIGILVLFALIAGCSLFGEEEDPIARISERGVDGVYFGDSIYAVLEELGPPYNVGWIDGPRRSWYHLTYGSNAVGDTLQIAFTIPSGGPDSLSVADGFALRNAYSGTTAEGIGIGSTTHEVREAFGEPIVVRGSDNSSRHFCMGKRDVELVIYADTVYAFFFGYNEPLQGWFTKCAE